MGIRKLQSANKVKVKRKRVEMSTEGKRNALIHMTSNIFGNDLIKTHLSDNPDLKNLLQTVDFKYASYIESSVKKLIEAEQNITFKTEDEFINFMECFCTVLRNDEPNPLNVLWINKGEANEKQLCTWRDSPDVIGHATKDHSITEE